MTISYFFSIHYSVFEYSTIFTIHCNSDLLVVKFKEPNLWSKLVHYFILYTYFSVRNLDIDIHTMSYKAYWLLEFN